jgi:hypothetical protein
VFWVTIGSNTNLHLTLIYLFSVLGNFTYHWELMIIGVTSVELTWLGLEWPTV